MYLAGKDAPFTGEDILWFINKLCGRYHKRNLLLIWDGAAIHRSQSVKDLLSHKPGQAQLERFLAYSPELNPVELVRSQLNRSLANQVFTSLGQLQEAILEQVTKLRADRK